MGISLLQQKTGFAMLPGQARESQTDYMTLVDKNGLIQVVPRPTKARTLSLAPFKLIAVFVVLVTVFKAMALLNVGMIGYEEELAVLASGNFAEQASAFVLQIDPVTQAVASNVSALLK